MELLTSDGFVHNSLEVARDFELTHADVLKVIRELLADGDDPSAEWFREAAYVQAGRRHTAYLMTNPGLALLVFSLPGDLAVVQKVRIINAFNRMLAELPESERPRDLWPDGLFN